MELYSNIDAYELLRMMVKFGVFEDESGWGYMLLKRSDLLDPENGYIKVMIFLLLDISTEIYY